MLSVQTIPLTTLNLITFLHATLASSMIFITGIEYENRTINDFPNETAEVDSASECFAFCAMSPICWAVTVSEFTAGRKKCQLFSDNFCRNNETEMIDDAGSTLYEKRIKNGDDHVHTEHVTCLEIKTVPPSTTMQPTTEITETTSTNQLLLLAPTTPAPIFPLNVTCPDESMRFFNGSCFVINTQLLNRKAAQETCDEEYSASRLAKIRNNNTNMFIIQMMMNNGVDNAYFGLFYYPNGTWSWPDDSPYDLMNDFKSFPIGEPNQGIEDCVSVMTNNKWQPDFNFMQNFVICVAQTTVGYSNLPPFTPTAQCQLSGFGKINGQCYYVNNPPARSSYLGAKDFCSSKSAYLPQPRNSQDMTDLKSFADSKGIQDNIWLGVTSNLQYNPPKWVYQDGTTAESTFWAPNEPNPLKQNSVIIAGYFRFAWDDINDSLEHSSICEFMAKSCAAWRKLGNTNSGIYRIAPDDGEDFEVYCDMETDGGGWTVIQSRWKATLDINNFNKTYQQYIDGFGDVKGNHWLGLDNMYRILTTENQDMLVELQMADGTTVQERYTEVEMEIEYNTYYKLTCEYVSGIDENAIDGMKTANDQYFESANYKICGKIFGGWWNMDCNHTNLNGFLIGHGVPLSSSELAKWVSETGNNVMNPIFTMMKIRETEFED